HELDLNEDPKLMEYVAKTLGAFHTLEARTESGQRVDPIVPLARALEPKYKIPVRFAAAASLAKQAARLNGRLDDPRAVEALGAAAADPDRELRQLAVYALGFFGGGSARDTLRERLASDDDRFVRYNAALALGRRGDRAAQSTLREMLSTSELEPAIQRPPPSEKQNKIESIELEAPEHTRAGNA